MLIANWVHWGKMPIHDWSQLSSSEMKARLTLAYRFDPILRNRLWLEAWEKTYEDHLKKMISANSQPKVRKQQSVSIGTVCLLY